MRTFGAFSRRGAALAIITGQGESEAEAQAEAQSEAGGSRRDAFSRGEGVHGTETPSNGRAHATDRADGSQRGRRYARTSAG